MENGATGTVLDIDERSSTVTVALRGREVMLGGEQLEALRLGYAQHVYSAQGRTVDRVYAVLGGWQTDREGSYVAVSRAREASAVFADYSSLEVAPGDRTVALHELAVRCGESRSKVAAVTVLERAGLPLPEVAAAPVRTAAPEAAWWVRDRGGIEAAGRGRERD